jgi:peptidoglycan/LPS O-acetylase OafA/YrhL
VSRTLAERAAEARSATRLPSLTGLRFGAAFLVFLTHVAVSRPFADQGANDELAKWLGRTGFLGVSFFFTLSGFVLTWSARPGERLLAFWRRRLMKIYPNNAVAWFAGLLLMLGVGQQVTAGQLLPSLFLVHGWFPQMAIVGGTNGSTWSLACELAFYLLFPLLLRLVRRIPERWLWGAAGLVVLAMWLVPLVAQLLPSQPSSPFQPVPWWRYWFTYFFPGTRVLDFLLGIVAARIVLSGRWIGPRLGPALLLLVPGYLLMTLLPGAFGLVAPTAVPIVLVIAAAALRDAAHSRTFFAGRTLVWLGEVSFAFYLVHFLVVAYGPLHMASDDPATRPTWSVPGMLAVSLASFLASLLLSWALYSLVEKPAMRAWGRRRERPGPRSAPPVDPTR